MVYSSDFPQPTSSVCNALLLNRVHWSARNIHSQYKSPFTTEKKNINLFLSKYFEHLFTCVISNILPIHFGSQVFPLVTPQNSFQTAAKPRSSAPRNPLDICTNACSRNHWWRFKAKNKLWNNLSTVFFF